MEGEAAYHQILFKDMDIFNIKNLFLIKKNCESREGSHKELMEILYVSIPLFRAVKQQLARILILA
jgi:uncharacterized phage-associated protein